MSTVTATKRVPPLENGDRLTRAEFEAVLSAEEEACAKIELIEQVVYMGSGSNWEYHGVQHADLVTVMGAYRARTPGVEAINNGRVRLDWDNMPQPDAALFVLPEFGGRVRNVDGVVENAPELMAEVCGSASSIDLGAKLEVYRRNKVQEYVVWRTYDEALDWFVLREGEFVRLEPDPSDGLLKSSVFPGLWLDATALVNRELAKVLAALARGTASTEHAAFVQRLAARTGSRIIGFSGRA